MPENEQVYFLSIFLFKRSSKEFFQSSLSDFSYVIVPEQFEFLNGRDKYQLNSLTKFLLDKQGFNTFMADDIPDARRCDGLFADVVAGKGVFTTKLSVVIKDCKGLEVFKSIEGVSKNRDYKKSYHEALQRAFKSLEGLGVIPI